MTNIIYLKWRCLNWSYVRDDCFTTIGSIVMQLSLGPWKGPEWYGNIDWISQDITKQIMWSWQDKLQRKCPGISWWYDVGSALHITGHLWGKGHPTTMNYPHKGPLMQILMCPLLLAWTSYWTNMEDTRELERINAECDIYSSNCI